MGTVAKYISLLLMICTLLSAICAFPINAKETYSISLSGTGQRLDPFRISSVSDLCKFRNLVNQGVDFKDKYFLQTCDLDLSEIGGAWTPIGNWETESFFYGTYNGGGHVIKNLLISGGNSGFFSCLGGKVLNLGIESGSIEGGCVGSITSHSVGSAMIINCYNKASVTGFRAGGIADNFSGGEIIDCWSIGTLTTNAADNGGSVGGLVGYDAECVIYSYSNGTSALPESFSGYCEFIDERPLSEAEVKDLEKRFKEASKNDLSAIALLMDSSFEGEGTKEDPYRIKNESDFLRFRTLTNLGCAFSGKWLRQEADIDLSAHENFIPIAHKGIFSGVYDGAGHAISNLSIHGEDGKRVALFGTLGGSVINLGIESGTISGTYAAAIVANGTGNVPMIVNCYNKATVIGTQSAGGICSSFASGIVVSCFNAGNITSDGTVGGISSESVKRMINSFSVSLPVAHQSTSGVIEDSCKSVESIELGAKLLNDSLYDSATITNFQNNDLFSWNSDATFGAKHIYFTRFIIQEIIIAVCFFALLILLILVWKTARRENSLKPRALSATLIDAKSKWHADPRFKIKATVYAVFIFAFGMMAVGYLNRDRSITNYFGYWPDTNDVFMDYINPFSSVTNNNYAQKGHYTNAEGTYPPIARAIFWLSGQVLPARSYFSSASQMRISQGVFVTFIVFAASLCILLLAYRKIGKTNIPLLDMMLVFCAPMMFLLDRGNILIVAYVATVGFILGYRSENTLVRHLSYVCLGIAAAIKIYPVVLGLLVLKRKSKKDTLWCIFYGAAFCILPFFFIGGVKELVLYARNVTSAFAESSVNVNGWLINYGNTLAGIFKEIFGNASIGRTFAGISIYPLVVLLAACALFCKEHSKAVLAAMLIIILYPGYSVAYCAIFYTIPLLLILAKEKPNKRDLAYAILLTFALIPKNFLCGGLGISPENVWLSVGVAGIALAVLLITDCTFEIVATIRSRKEAVAEAQQ